MVKGGKKVHEVHKRFYNIKRHFFPGGDRKKYMAGKAAAFRKDFHVTADQRKELLAMIKRDTSFLAQQVGTGELEHDSHLPVGVNGRLESSRLCSYTTRVRVEREIARLNVSHPTCTKPQTPSQPLTYPLTDPKPTSNLSTNQP
jgi:hypothetical protein